MRALAAVARTTFYDITVRGELDRSEFQSSDRQTLEERLQDLHDQFHDHVLQDRVDHLMKPVRSVWASAPEQFWGVASVSMEGSSRVTNDTPDLAGASRPPGRGGARRPRGGRQRA